MEDTKAEQVLDKRQTHAACTVAESLWQDIDLDRHRPLTAVVAWVVVEVEKPEMASSQQGVEPAAVAAAAAAAAVHVDVVGVAAVAAGADAAVAAGVGVGVGVGAAGGAGILPVRTRAQKHHVQIHSRHVLCAY